MLTSGLAHAKTHVCQLLAIQLGHCSPVHRIGHNELLFQEKLELAVGLLELELLLVQAQGFPKEPNEPGRLAKV